MRNWILLTCLLLAPGLAPADEDPARDPGDPGGAQFERALEARVDAVLGARVDLAAERAVALLEAREAERFGEVAQAPAPQAGPERGGVEARVHVAKARLLPWLAEHARESLLVQRAVDLDPAHAGPPLSGDGGY